MPIFEYQCRECDAEFEKLVMHSNGAEEVNCPECRCREVERLFSTFSGRSTTPGGAVRSMSSGCASCSASSCAGCKR